jgi:hypothetical protein
MATVERTYVYWSPASKKNVVRPELWMMSASIAISVA